MTWKVPSDPNNPMKIMISVEIGCNWPFPLLPALLVENATWRKPEIAQSHPKSPS